MVVPVEFWLYNPNTAEQKLLQHKSIEIQRDQMFYAGDTLCQFLISQAKLIWPEKNWSEDDIRHSFNTIPWCIVHDSCTLSMRVEPGHILDCTRFSSSRCYVAV